MSLIDAARARDVEVLGVGRIHDHLFIDELAAAEKRYKFTSLYSASRRRRRAAE